MRLVRLAIIGVLVGGAAIVGRAQGPATATFHGAGAVPGNPAGISTVRDATKVGNVIYGVGGWQNGNSVLWSWDNGNPVSFIQLPNVSTPGSGGVSATAITPDASYIGGQARSTAGVVAVRVTRSLLPSSSANLNLNAAPYTPLTTPTSVQAISVNGQILYGNGSGRAARFDVNLGTTTLVPLVGTTNNSTAMRGTSSDGSVMVGTSVNGGFNGINGHAFRYVHSEPVGTASAIPELIGVGAWSKAIAVSPDGNLTLAAGNSTVLPNGEGYLYNATTNANTPIGSPNTAWTPASPGGLTADGSVVVMTFTASCSPLPCTPARGPYVRNSHGWFQLSSALLAAGANIADDGWSMEGGTVFGISPDGTLVFGQALHENDDDVTGFRRFEGFVAEFPAGFLANYNPQPVAPANTSIVGAWFFADDNPDVSARNPVLLFLLGDGTYFHIEANSPASEQGGTSGFERGLYTWDAVSQTFMVTTLQDTNGDIGFSGANGVTSMSMAVPDCNFGPGTRIVGAAGSAVGGWVRGNPALPNSSVVLMLLDDGTYYMALDGDSSVDPSGHDGIEKGTYSWDPFTHAFSSSSTVDTNGAWGLGSFSGLQLSPNDLVATFSAGLGLFPFNRIVDPNLVPVITSFQSATGTIGIPFTYTVTATHSLTFDAQGLPAGLSIDSGTGVISGTPSAAGSFEVAISAANTYLGTGPVSLSLVINAPAVSLSAASLVYGNQNVGTTSAAQAVTLSNTGNGPLALSISITGANAADFVQVNDCSGLVASAGNCTINVTFTPTNTGTRTATVSISDNATGSPQTVSLSGTGKTGQLKLTPDPLVFGAQALGTTSGSQVVKVQNTGTTAVSFSSIVPGGDFAIAGTTCGSTLAVAATCNVNVTFSPTAGGLRSGLLTVATTAGNGLVTLTGTGDIASVSPTSMNFGNQTVGVNSAPRTVTLTNASAVTTLGISSVTIGGTNAGDFAIANACGSTLAPGANCGVAITFKPTKKGNRSASLTIVDNGGGAPRVVSLTGFGK